MATFKGTVNGTDVSGTKCYNIAMTSDKTNNMVGKKFGRLTVIERSGSKNQKRTWLCECECGNESVVTTGDLRSGNTKSCGCYATDMIIKTNKERAGEIYPDAKCNTKGFNSWRGAKERCENPNHVAYDRYGGRGIEMRLSLKEMIDEIGERPSKKHSLDRIDVNGHYEKGNIRWANNTTQARNTRRSTKGDAGVHQRSNGKWRAYIGVDGEVVHLGTYETEEEAREAREEGKDKHW